MPLYYTNRVFKQLYTSLLHEEIVPGDYINISFGDGDVKFIYLGLFKDNNHYGFCIHSNVRHYFNGLGAGSVLLIDGFTCTLLARIQDAKD